MTDPNLKRDRDSDDERDPKRPRTDANQPHDSTSEDGSSDSSPSDNSSESDFEDEEQQIQAPADPIATWVGQCYDSGLTPQQIYQAAIDSWGQEAADGAVALHNVRLLAAADAQQQATTANVVVTAEVVQNQPVPAIVLDDDVESVDWEQVPGQGVQYAPVEYDDWQQMAATEGDVVFANAVANPFDVFTSVADTDIPDDDCTICTEKLTTAVEGQDQALSQVVKSTRCPHCFHRQCIVDLTGSATVWQCPLCRTSWS